MKKKSLIVLSGGLDSTTLLYDKKEEVGLAVSFRYGSNHNEKEIPFAKLHCDKLGIKHIVIDLLFIGKLFKSSLLSGSQDVPRGDYGEENMRSTVVPFRNGIMLSIAAGIAESNGLQSLLIANHFGDHSIYPDCTKKFVDAMNSAVQAGTYAGIKIDAPYTQKSKAEIVAIGAKLNLDFSKTWSCYCGLEEHCGHCGTCLERKQAFKDAGVIDPTIYQEEK